MSTTNPNHKPNNNVFVAISLSDLGEPKKYFCNLCNRSLVRMNENEKASEYFCTNCNVSFFPNQGEKLKSQSKFDLPGPEIDSKGRIIGDKMPLISIVDDTPKPKDSMPTYFKEMEKHGLKITSFTTTEEK